MELIEGRRSTPLYRRYILYLTGNFSVSVLYLQETSMFAEEELLVTAVYLGTVASGVPFSAGSSKPTIAPPGTSFTT